MSCIARDATPPPGWRDDLVVDHRVDLALRDQLADDGVADVGVDEVGALEPRTRGRTSSRRRIRHSVALEPARELPCRDESRRP